MTPLPKHLEEMRDEFAQWHYDTRAKLFNVHEFDRETIAVESCKLGFNQAASITLKDMESMAKALDKIETWADKKEIYASKITMDEDDLELLYMYIHEALKIWREKYGVK